jgi:hypothetical protein
MADLLHSIAPMRCVVGALTLLASSTGCFSFLTVRGPNGRSPSNCTTSDTAPIIDTVIASAGVISGATLIVGGCTTQNGDPATCTGFTAVGTLFLIIPAIVVATSAAYGFQTTSRCRGAGEPK